MRGGDEQLFRIFNSLLDIMNRTEYILACPACNRRLEDPMLLTCDHIICRSCLATRENVACPKCNITSSCKDVRRYFLIEELVMISKETRSSLRDVTAQFVSNDVSIAPKNYFTSMCDEKQKLVLLGCDLNLYETDMLMKFADQNSAIRKLSWSDNITHVVISSDDSSTFRRAFEFLMSVLLGRWIISIEWIKACMQAGRLVPEAPYEVKHELHGCDGPKKGRVGVTNKAPKLFAGLGFFLSSYLESLHRVLLEELLITAGGTIIEAAGLDLSDAASEAKPLKKYIVINEDEPRLELSSGNTGKVIDERSEEVRAFYKKTGSPRFVGYATIADAIASYDNRILDKEYGAEWGVLLKA